MNGYLIFYMSLLTLDIAATVSMADTSPPNLTPTIETKCQTEDGKPGVCVPFSLCNKTHVLPFGNIHDSELRQLDACGKLDWCCSLELVLEVDKATTISKTSRYVKEPSSSISTCELMQSDICLWCVTLHKVFDKSIRDREAFCMGSLISSNVILTAATCLIASEKFTLFARAPASAYKNKNYYEKRRIYNPAYNSGTHFNDFGIIILDENVAWETDPAQNACLSFKEMSGECLTFGLDEEDKIISTVIEPTEARCTELGGTDSLEVMCGQATDLTCNAIYGAPVVCQTNIKNNGGELVGVVRSNCVNNEVLLGRLTGSLLWLNTLLPTISVDMKTVTIK